MSTKVFWSIIFLIITTYCCSMYTCVVNRCKDKKLELRVASLEQVQAEIVAKLSGSGTTNKIETVTANAR